MHVSKNEKYLTVSLLIVITVLNQIHVVKSVGVCDKEGVLECAHAIQHGSTCVISNGRCILDPCIDLDMEKCMTLSSTGSDAKQCWWSPIDAACQSGSSLCVRHFTKEHCESNLVCHWEGNYCELDAGPQCYIQGESTVKDMLADPTHYTEKLSHLRDGCKPFPKIAGAAVVLFFLGLCITDGFLIFLIFRMHQRSISGVRKENVTLDLVPLDDTFQPKDENAYSPPIATDEEKSEKQQENDLV